MTNNENLQLPSVNIESIVSDDCRSKIASLALALSELSPYDNNDDPEMPSHIIRGRE